MVLVLLFGVVRGWSGIDIFRFDADSEFVEHRYVLQVVPDTSANQNTMF